MPSSPMWLGDSALAEDAASPLWVFGDRVTCTRTYTGPHSSCLAGAKLKGANGTGDMAGMRVVESRVTRNRGGVGQLVIVYETVGQPAQGGALPADEISFEPQKIERPLKKHPRYSNLTADQLKAIDLWLESLEEDSSAKVAAAKATVQAAPLALELYRKLRADFTHWALYPPAVKITSYSWNAPSPSAGGFRQTPPISPIDLPAGLDWLREGDSLNYNGTHWVLVRSWIGAPNLDPEIYP